MPSVNHRLPAEIAGNARCTVLIKRGARHSSPVGINCKAQQCRATGLSLRRPHQDRQQSSK